MNVNNALLKFVKIGAIIVIVLAVIYAAIHFSNKGFDFGYRIFTETAIDEYPGTDIMIQVKDGMDGKDIGKVLEESGLVRDGDLFALQLKFSAYSKKIKPGVYTLNTSQTPRTMILVMAKNSITDSTEDFMTELEE